jgi:hypothetical protein
VQLSAKNDEGQSKWSDPVTFRTLPDRPAAPPKPQIKGKVMSHAFTITWGEKSLLGQMNLIAGFTIMLAFCL